MEVCSSVAELDLSSGPLLVHYQGLVVEQEVRGVSLVLLHERCKENKRFFFLQRWLLCRWRDKQRFFKTDVVIWLKNFLKSSACLFLSIEKRELSRARPFLQQK